MALFGPLRCLCVGAKDAGRDAAWSVQGGTRPQRTGRVAEGGPFEIPNGPCRLFKDPSGSWLVLFQDVRPGAIGEDRTTPGVSSPDSSAG